MPASRDETAPPAGRDGDDAPVAGDPVGGDEVETCLRVLAAARTGGLAPDVAARLDRAVTEAHRAVKKRRKARRAEAVREHDRTLLAATRTFAHEIPDTAPPPDHTAPAPTADAPVGDRAVGDAAAGDGPAGGAPVGDATAGGAPFVDGPVGDRPVGGGVVGGDATLRRARHCYVCKGRYRRVDARYHQLCPDCAAVHAGHRDARCDLRGRRAVVTGGRVKIGFHVALKLLRDGADVLVTTRFPRDAARRYARVADFADWADRLHVHGVDLLDLAGVVDLITLVRSRGPLDILVNNAAQTLHRPAGYHRAVRAAEREPLTGPAASIPLSGTARPPATPPSLATASAPTAVPPSAITSPIVAASPTAPDPSTGTRPSTVPAPTTGTGSTAGTGPTTGAGPSSVVARSAASPRVPPAAAPPEDAGTAAVASPDASSAVVGGGWPADVVEAVFPAGRTDETGQPLDLRAANSWVLRDGEVSPREWLEVHVVNAFAPFLLTSRLRPVLESSPYPDRYVVQVSAMEGNYSRAYKGPAHPHTNMAKAALNMLTRTVADDYRRSGIFVNSVDTGWVTDERPHPSKAAQRDAGFRPPLDVVDGAARVYDPIVRGVRGEPVHGRFLKDYRSAEW